MAFGQNNFNDLIEVALKHNASDIHLRESESPCFRILGKLNPIQSKPFDGEDMENIARILLASEDKWQSFKNRNDTDGSYTIEKKCRLRFNLLRFQGKLAIVMRIIKTRIPTLDELLLPPAIKKIAMAPRGLTLVTGVTGSGKSTTLAAMINQINLTKRSHILTLEDPIEYVHPQLKSRITQREIGTDTPDFMSALKFALRQDPDVISIGEMRDPETMSIALKAAETGHMVLSTIHTTDALATTGRLISMFPSEEQGNIRKRLADNLYATISQRLIPAAEGNALLPVLEVMINNPGIRDCILGEDDLANIYNYIRKGQGQDGSQTFDQHIEFLLRRNLITEATAASASGSDDLFKQIMFE
jgi:twitching motility protein PilT